MVEDLVGILVAGGVSLAIVGLKTIGGLPRDQMHCAELAAETLGAALNDYMLKSQTKPTPRAAQS